MAQREVYVGTRFRARPVGREPDAVTRALADPSTRRVMVSDGTDLIRADHRGGGRWRLKVIARTPSPGRRAFGHAHTSRRGVDTATTSTVLSSFLADTDAWRTAVRWRRSWSGRSPLVLIPLVFVVGTAGTLAVQGATGNLDGWSWDYLPNLVVGVGMISLITMYASLFFDVIRPVLARRLGARLGLEVVESTDVGLFENPGHWEARGGSPARKVTVMAVDLTVLLVGGVLPMAAIGVGVVLAARPILN